MNNTAAQRCEYEDCAQPAVGYVEAQWTIFDFVRYEGCDPHILIMADQLARRVVADQPASLYLGFYEGSGYYW